MKKYVVLTDSTCDIPEEIAQKHGIDILSFTVILDGKEYDERRDLDPDQFYKLLDEAEGMPTTAQITSITFAETFERYDAEGVEELLYVSINSTGSSTYSNAVFAAQQYAEEHPDSKLKIYIVDSHTYSMGYGRFVIRAAEKLAAGAEMADVIDYLNERFSRVEIVLSVHSLKIIKRSGRISAAAAFAGELLGLRPIITLIGGKTAVVQKVRGDAKMLPALAAYLKAHAGDRSPYLIGATKGAFDRHGDARQLAKLCEKEMGYPPESIFRLGAAVTSNTGTDAIAIIYLKEGEESAE